MATPCQIVQFIKAVALLNCVFRSVGSTMQSIHTDKVALLSFKSRLVSSTVSSLSSWNPNSSPCNWTGVICSKYGNKRVVELRLSGMGLSGFIDPHIGNLSFLQSLQLQNNQFTGPIPIQIHHLLQLSVVNVSSNNLQGGFPLNFSAMAALEILDLSSNKITGRLPESLELGTKPTLWHNSRNLWEYFLVTLALASNQLYGTVPPAIFNMSSLVTLALASNQLWGTFPKDIGEKLPKLLVFNFCFNKFTGTIPESLHNITRLQVIRFAHNFLEGTVPPGLEKLHNLLTYNIGNNKFVDSDANGGLNFITSLTNSSRLAFLALDGNNFEGVIPGSIGNLSKDLSKLYMGGNRFYGNIPPTISNLRGLSLLNLSDNSLSGEIPSREIGKASLAWFGEESTFW
ncbi:unnamed protein product [Citrullus colocynthis]|uniref:Leucine-rich repeat-containing N-terminal plant-type domain-containing protein n=1 Tax=Citrullus colocynthis TaxID=252529 RepID=A0ABP0Y0Q2_9ROSI